jgi:hypothetical protein
MMSWILLGAHNGTRADVSLAILYPDGRELVHDEGRLIWDPVLAGSGIKGGQVLGATDARGAEVTKDPYQVEDLVATMYDRVDIDFTHEYETPINRPVKLSNGGQGIAKLL